MRLVRTFFGEKGGIWTGSFELPMCGGRGELPARGVSIFRGLSYGTRTNPTPSADTRPWSFCSKSKSSLRIHARFAGALRPVAWVLHRNAERFYGVKPLGCAGME
jgi:hypothetical protein